MRQAVLSQKFKLNKKSITSIWLMLDARLLNINFYLNLVYYN